MTSEGQYNRNTIVFLNGGDNFVTMNASTNGSMTFSTAHITGQTLLKNIRNPVDNQDVATKSYVDTQVTTAGGNWKEPVNAASTANIGFTYGAGGAITAAPNTIDGTGLANGNRVLVKDQTNEYENGIYVVDTVGTGSDGVWSRATDMADASDAYGIATYVLVGTANDSRTFIQTANVVVGDAGANDQIWEEQGVAAPGLSTQVIFNDGGVLAGNADLTFDKSTDLFTVGSGAAGNVAIGSFSIDSAAANTTLSASSNVVIETSAEDRDMTVRSGAGTTGTTGNTTISSGAVTTGTSGELNLSTGAASGVGTSGNVDISSGSSVGGDAGDVNITGGNGGAGTGGEVIITSGSGTTAAGNVEISAARKFDVNASAAGETAVEISTTGSGGNMVFDTSDATVSFTPTRADSNAFSVLTAGNNAKIDLRTTTVYSNISLTTTGSCANIILKTSATNSAVKLGTTGEKGNVFVYASNANANIVIKANATTTNAGSIYINRNCNGAGGTPVSTNQEIASNVYIDGGRSTNETGTGGSVFIRGGDAGTGGTGTGGGVTITTGFNSGAPGTGSGDFTVDCKDVTTMTADQDTIILTTSGGATLSGAAAALTQIGNTTTTGTVAIGSAVTSTGSIEIGGGMTDGNGQLILGSTTPSTNSDVRLFKTFAQMNASPGTSVVNKDYVDSVTGSAAIGPEGAVQFKTGTGFDGNASLIYDSSATAPKLDIGTEATVTSATIEMGQGASTSAINSVGTGGLTVQSNASNLVLDTLTSGDVVVSTTNDWTFSGTNLSSAGDATFYGAGAVNIDSASTTTLSASTAGVAIDSDDRTVTASNTGAVMDVQAFTGTVAANESDIVATSFAQPTLAANNAEARVVTHSSTVYIEGAPQASNGGITLSNAYSLFVDDGKSRFDGVVETNDIQSVGSTATVNLYTDPEIGTLNFATGMVGPADTLNIATVMDEGTINIGTSMTTGTVQVGGASGTTMSFVYNRDVSDYDTAGGNIVANKQYVDSIAAGLHWKEAVKFSTVAGDMTQDPGSGVTTSTYDVVSPSGFDTITWTGTGTYTIDGGTIALNDRILVQNDASTAGTGAVANSQGIYTVTQLDPLILTRAADALGATVSEDADGVVVFTQQGSTHADVSYVQTENVTFGGDLLWSVFSTPGGAAGPTQAIQYNNGSNTFAGVSTFEFDNTAPLEPVMSIGNDSGVALTGATFNLATNSSTDSSGTINLSKGSGNSLIDHAGTGTLTIENSSATNDTIMKLGDASGATSLTVANSGGTTQFDVNSNGAFFSLGNADIRGGTVENTTGALTVNATAGDLSLTTTTSGTVTVDSADQATATSTTGTQLDVATQETTISTAAADVVFTSFAAPTVTDDTANDAITQASTVYIAGAPSTNGNGGFTPTITDAWALNVASGNVNIAGNLVVSGTILGGAAGTTGDVQFNNGSNSFAAATLSDYTFTDSATVPQLAIGVENGTFSLLGQDGTADGAEGSNIVIASGDGATNTNAGDGGNLTLTAGTGGIGGVGGGVGVGGSITLTAGDAGQANILPTAAGGSISLTAGKAGFNDGTAGVINITGGEGDDANNAAAGAINITGGSTPTDPIGSNKLGGDVVVKGGGTYNGSTNAGSAFGGKVTLQGGDGGILGIVSGNGGDAELLGGTGLEGAGGDVVISGGNSTSTGSGAGAQNYAGGDISITSGTPANNGNAGNVSITAALAGGSGADGSVFLGSTTSANANVSVRYLRTVADITAENEPTSLVNKKYVDDAVIGGAAGSTTEIQYNNGGNFAASAGFTWTDGSDLLTIGTGGTTSGITADGSDTFTLTHSSPGDQIRITTIAGSSTAGGQIQLASGAGDGANAGGEIDLTAGNAGATGTGGIVDINAGEGGVTSGNGGNVEISAGISPANGDGNGGGLILSSGSVAFGTNGGNGGPVQISAGAGGFNGAVGPGGAGGSISITAGAGQYQANGGNMILSAGDAGGTGGSGAGGFVSILAGDAANDTGIGGNINITAGDGDDSGDILLRGGLGRTTGVGGEITIQGGDGGSTSGAGGPVNIIAGPGGTSGSGAGGDVSITAGAATGTNQDGGDIVITAGANTGTGAAGIVDVAVGILNIQDATDGTAGGAGSLVSAGGASFAKKVYGLSFHSTSDVRFKTNIEPISDPLNTIRKIEGYSYNWKEGVDDGKRHYGVLAQQMESVGLEEFVSGDGAEQKAVDYLALVPFLIGAVKQLSGKIEELEAEKSTGTTRSGFRFR